MPKFKDSVEFADDIEVDATDKGAANAAAATIAAQPYVSSAVVTGMQQARGKATVHVVMRVPKGAEPELPAPVIERLSALGLIEA